MFYLLTANGLFICRNHPFFQSCVPAQSGPAELAGQETYVDLSYPKIPRRLLELTVGFFTQIGQTYNAEALVMILWDNRNQKLSLIVPRQKARIYQGNYGTFPLGVDYEAPVHLPQDHIILGDIHSHVGMAAFSSDTDRRDEKNRPGLHVVVGRIHREPPEFHAELIVDGLRFKVEPNRVLEDYWQRARISTKYLKQVQIETLYPFEGRWNNSNTGNSHFNPPKGGGDAAGAGSNDDILRIE
jgi:PRTRC genetic system protein A